MDDMPHPAGMLVGLGVMSPHAHARISAMDLSAARAVEGVYPSSAEDILGENLVGRSFTMSPSWPRASFTIMGSSSPLSSAPPMRPVERLGRSSMSTTRCRQRP